MLILFRILQRSWFTINNLSKVFNPHGKVRRLDDKSLISLIFLIKTEKLQHFLSKIPNIKQKILNKEK